MLFKITHRTSEGKESMGLKVKADRLYDAICIYQTQVGVELKDIVSITEIKEDKKMNKSAVETTKATKKSETKKAEPKAAPIKKTPVKKIQDQTETKGATATFELNNEHNGIEIKFSEKPSAEVREAMKALKFRWHGVKQLWYAKQSAETIALAEKICGVKAEPKKQETAEKSEPKAQAKAETVAQPKAEEPKEETKKPSRKGIESYKPKDGERICERLIKALNRTEGIKAEVVATKEGEEGWLWVTGEATKEHKDTLKNLGFFWSGKKQAWYLSPAPLKRGYKSQFKSMDAVRAAAIA